MAKTREEKIASYEERIAQLENLKKAEKQKMKVEERKARTKRLCSRHGLLEKHMPDLIEITDEQFDMFVRKAINTTYGQKILSEIKAAPSQTVEPTQKTDSTPTATSAKQQQASGTSGNSNQPQTAVGSGAK